MLKNYFLVALRSFKKNRAFSLLNTLGLTIGITCAIIVYLFVFDEFTYDSNHSNRENIYRLNSSYHLPNNGGFEEYAVAGPLVAEVLVNDFPEIKQSVRFHPIKDVVLQMPGADEVVYENVIAADSNVFQLFTFPFIAGDPRTALVEPQSIVLSEEKALKYFGKVEIVGETLYSPEDSMVYKVTGVIANHPQNTHLKFDILISFETLKSLGYHLQSWWSYQFYTYLELEEAVDVEALNEKIKLISRNYIANQEDESGYYQEYALVPLTSIHLYSNLREEIEPNSKASYVYIFIIIGVFILVIACINFMNLATARAALRAKEIGLRKVSGAFRGQLIGQFLSESVLLTLFAMVLSVVLAYLLLPMVNQFTGKQLLLSGNVEAWFTILLITLFVGILAGSYPSIFLSALRPTETLKGNFRTGAKGNALRKSLVIFQFAISIILISGTLIVYSHLNYIRSIDLGFQKDRVVILPTRMAEGAFQNFTVLKHNLQSLSAISDVTLSSVVPGIEMGNNVVRIGWDEGAPWSDMRFITADENFATLYQIEMVDGRFFSEAYPSDVTQAFVLNESGARRLGFATAQEAIGKPLKWQDRKGRVIGVVKDFHFMSANVSIEPFIFVMNADWSVGYLSAKVASGNFSQTIEQVRKEFRKVMPNKLFEFSFLDSDFDQQFKSEEKFMSIFSICAGIAIVIACLGLYGLAMFMSELKNKEIGIRKVLGASVPSLIGLFIREFSLLVLIAFMIAVPIAYVVMLQWLSSFPYREEINPVLFVAGGLIAIIIAVLTVGYQSIKAASVNPVDSLSNQ